MPCGLHLHNQLGVRTGGLIQLRHLPGRRAERNLSSCKYPARSNPFASFTLQNRFLLCPQDIIVHCPRSWLKAEEELLAAKAIKTSSAARHVLPSYIRVRERLREVHIVGSGCDF